MDMENTIWQKVLIDWVNCLKLSKPIQRLDDLRDGIFFSNLQKVIKKSTEIEQDVLTCLFYVLNQHYPKFIIRNKSNVHISDINIEDLFYITSLLMHYTCIHDRRDVLTSPLCHHLQRTTQVCIRNFLEKAQEYSELTNESLRAIIALCETETEKNVTEQSQWLSLPFVMPVGKSPLQDILKTPSTKGGKLLEKDKEITRLKTDLELVQEEKENLEDDLKLQTERNKKLESQLNQKNLEISRLRSEVLVLESRTPPHYQDKDSRETQRILRTKVESLEQIIEQCDKENEELLEQRDAARAQVKLLESQCKTWLEKFIETDNTLQVLAEHSSEQETKYETLRNHCNELESLLDELQHKTHNNESFTEDSFHGSNRRSKNFEAVPSCEDLAHSVVDVQLKEKEKENEELKTALNKMEAEFSNLNKVNRDLEINAANLLSQNSITTEQLEKALSESACLLDENVLLKEKHSIVLLEIETLIKTNREFEIQISQFKVENAEILKSLKKVTEDCCCLSKEKVQLENEICSVTKKLEKITSAKTAQEEQFNITVHRKDLQIDKLTKEIQNLEHKNSQLQDDLQQKDSLISKLEILSSEKTVEIDELSKTKLYLTEQTSGLNNNLELLESKLKLSKNQYESLFEERTKDAAMFTKDKLNWEGQISKLTNDLQENRDEKNNLQITCDTLLNAEHNLKEELLELNSNLQQTIKQKEILQNEFKSNEIQKDQEINILTKEKNDLINEIFELNRNMNIIMTENADLNKRLVNVIEENSVNIEKIIEEKLDLHNQISELENCVQLLTDEKHSLSEQVHNLAEEKVKDLEKFEADKIILNEEMEELKIQIGDLIQDRNNVNKKLENIVQSRDKDLEIFTREKGDLDAEISELNGKLVQSIQDVQKVSSENCQLNNKLQNVVKQNEVLLEQLEDIRIKKAEDIEILTKENREFIKQISELNEKLDAFVNENVALHQKLKAVMDEKNEHVETLTNDKLELNNKVRQLIEEKNTLSHQLEELSESNSKNIETFKNEKLVLNNKICEINDTFRVLTQLGKYVEDRVINFTSHISSLTDENSCLQTEVDQTTSEKLIIEEQYHLTKENDNINNVVLDIKTKLQQVFTKAATFQEQFDNISHKLIRKVEESTNEKKILEDRISEVSHQLKFATERNQEFEIIMQDKGREIEKIANENQNLERVNCELIACSEGLRKENLCLIQQITDLNAEVQTLKKEFVNLDKEREKNHQEKLRELEQMKKDKENTRSQISALSIKVTELMDENSKMCEQLESLSNKNMINIEQCTDEKVNFSSLISKIESKLNHLTKENEHLHKLCTGKDEIIDDLEKSRQVLIDRVSELQNILEKLTNENAELTARLNDLHQQQVKIDTEISELSKEKLELSEQNLDLNKQLQEQTLNKAFLNQQFETFSNEQTKNMEELFQEKLALENKISVLSEQYQSQLGEKATEIEKLSNQILELSEQLHNLSKEKDTLSRETESNIKMLKTDFNKITKEKLDLEQKLTELTKENTINKQELLLENERILGQLNTALESLKLNDKTLAELSEEKEQQLTQIANFANQVDQLSEAKRDIVEELTNDKLALQNEISCLTSKLEEMSTEQSTCLEKMTNKQSENEKLKTLLSEADNDQKTLKQEMSELKTQIQQLITANKDNNQQLSNLEKEKQILTENLKKIEEEKKVVSNFLDLNNTELQKVIEEREKILEALEMSNKEVERVNQQKEKIILQLDSMFEDTELFKQEVEDLKKENQSSTDKIAELYKRIEERETYINDLEKTNKEIEIECQSKQTQLSNMSESIRIYEDNIDILQKEKLSFITQISDINTKFEIVTKEKLSLSEQIEKLLHEKADFSEQLDKVSQENVDYSKKLQCILKQSVEASDLLQKCDRLSEENAQLLGKITSLSNDLDAKTKEVNVLEVSSKQLKKILDEKSDILEKVTNENNNIFEIVDRLSQEKCDMAQSLEITLKELEKRSEEKSQLVQQLSDISNQYEKLSEENHTLRECLDVSKTELQKVKRERNELLESQTKIMKETENNIMLAHEFKNDLKKRIDLAENDKLNLKTQYEAEITKLKEAYTHAVTSNSRTEMEKVNLRKKIEEKNQQIAEYSQIKEAYEKLLEENSKLMTEVDTVKYKRSRDREEFVNLLKKEREEADVRGNKKVRQVRNEYEGKLEKMKEKMLKLYREEVHKEMQKVKAGQGESDFLLKTVEDLRNQLFDAEEKIHLLETELDMKKINESRMQDCIMTLRDREPHYATIRDSVTSLRSTGHESDHWHRPSSIQLPRKVHSVVSINTCEDREMRSRNDRKIATLPRGQVTEIEETVMISRRTSINNGIPTGIGNLEMEDEDDDFNNKYLADLKAGKCTVNETGRESNINRFSELAWRNSMVPPHLKSSYPAEMQFVNPSHFKEEDIKSGNVELDDSLCRLLPNEKPRQKKDIGTTSYKKPGPPTPSKNGRRLSLQGNEVQPLREQNHRLTITPRKVTPSRIRSLFMGRTNVSRDNTENLSTTPKGTNNKRLSFFRKQK